MNQQEAMAFQKILKTIQSMQNCLLLRIIHVFRSNLHHETDCSSPMAYSILLFSFTTAEQTEPHPIFPCSTFTYCNDIYRNMADVCEAIWEKSVYSVYSVVPLTEATYSSGMRLMMSLMGMHRSSHSFARWLARIVSAACFIAGKPDRVSWLA